MAGKKMYRTEQMGKPQGVPLMRASYAFNMRKGREQTKDDGSKKMEWGATLILPKSDIVGLKKLQSMVAEVITNEWGEKGMERFKAGLIRNPILPGDGKEARNKDTGEINPGLGADVVFIRAKSNDPVKVFNKAVMPASDDEIVSGHWGYPVLNASAWHNDKNGDGVSFGISMFQFVKADESLGGEGSGGDPNAFFERISDEGGETAPATNDASGLFD